MRRVEVDVVVVVVFPIKTVAVVMDSAGIVDVVVRVTGNKMVRTRVEVKLVVSSVLVRRMLVVVNTVKKPWTVTTETVVVSKKAKLVKMDEVVSERVMVLVLVETVTDMMLLVKVLVTVKVVKEVNVVRATIERVTKTFSTTTEVSNFVISVGLNTLVGVTGTPQTVSVTSRTAASLFGHCPSSTSP